MSMSDSNSPKPLEAQRSLNMPFRNGEFEHRKRAYSRSLAPIGVAVVGDWDIKCQSTVYKELAGLPQRVSVATLKSKEERNEYSDRSQNTAHTACH